MSEGDTPFLDFALAEEGDKINFFSAARAQRDAKEERIPILGDTVHYSSGATEGHFPCWAALVVKVDDFTDDVNLIKFDPNGEASPFLGAQHDETKTPFTWHWPHE